MPSTWTIVFAGKSLRIKKSGGKVAIGKIGEKDND